MSPPDIEAHNGWYCIIFKKLEPVKEQIKRIIDPANPRGKSNAKRNKRNQIICEHP